MSDNISEDCEVFDAEWNRVAPECIPNYSNLRSISDWSPFGQIQEQQQPRLQQQASHPQSRRTRHS